MAKFSDIKTNQELYVWWQKIENGDYFIPDEESLQRKLPGVLEIANSLPADEKIKYLQNQIDYLITSFDMRYAHLESIGEAFYYDENENDFVEVDFNEYEKIFIDRLKKEIKELQEKPLKEFAQASTSLYENLTEHKKNIRPDKRKYSFTFTDDMIKILELCKQKGRVKYNSIDDIIKGEKFDVDCLKDSQRIMSLLEPPYIKQFNVRIAEYFIVKGQEIKPKDLNKNRFVNGDIDQFKKDIGLKK